jgi:hypothetical protein
MYNNGSSNYIPYIKHKSFLNTTYQAYGYTWRKINQVINIINNLKYASIRMYDIFVCILIYLYHNNFN